MSEGVQRWINVGTLKMEEDLLPDIREVHINPIEISNKEHKLIGTV